MGFAQFAFTVLAVACVFNAISAQDDIKKAMGEMVKQCQKETGASDADLAALRDRKLPETKEGVCMFECFFNNAKVMQDGKYNKDGLIAALTPMMGGDETKIEKLKEMAVECEKELGSDTDKCIVSKNLMHCTVVKGKDFGFEYPNYF